MDEVRQSPSTRSGSSRQALHRRADGLAPGSARDAAPAAAKRRSAAREAAGPVRLPPGLWAAILCLAASLLGPSPAWTKGQHGDPCPEDCSVKDKRCRRGCDGHKPCLERCDLEKQHCPDLCRATFAVALDPPNRAKQKRFHEVRTKRRKALDQLERAQRARGEDPVPPKMRDEGDGIVYE